MEEKKQVAATWRIVAIAALCACAVLCGLYLSKPSAPAQEAAPAASAEPAADEQTAETDAEATPAATDEDPLSLWNDDAPAKKALMDYVQSVTDESSPDFIPAEDRIATFDVDGTLLNETDPNYFDYMLLVHRVLEDSSYKASKVERRTAKKIVDQNENGTKYDELPVEHGQAVASAFQGLTVDEFYDYVHDFAKTNMESYEGMQRGESFYQPMVQVVQYLQANDFDVYMMSGTDRLIMRGLFSSDLCPLNIPLDHILGSDESLVGSNQGEEDGLDYTFSTDEQLVLGGEFLMKTLKENKVYIIQREIAKQPVLSFGNSSGDFSMHNYALSNPDYKSAVFQLCCDDVERENGNVEKAEEMRTLCEENGYVAVSMANDWKTIYGDDVTYVGAEEELAEAA